LFSSGDRLKQQRAVKKSCGLAACLPVQFLRRQAGLAVSKYYIPSANFQLLIDKFHAG